MSEARLFVSLIKWDIVRELRRKETVLNMTLFAVLMLFLVTLGIGALLVSFENPLEQLRELGTSSPSGAEEDLRVASLIARLRELGKTVGPVFFWVIILFAGTVGLSQSFAAEREGNTITGIVMAPLDLGFFYLAKVAATWIYVMLMALILLVVFVLLFNIRGWSELGLVAVMGVFTLGYVASGVLLAAMTTTLRAGGGVVLRILLYPLLIPLVSLTLRVKEGTFGADVASAGDAEPLAFWHYVGLALAIDTVYLAVGFLLFPKIFEE